MNMDKIVEKYNMRLDAYLEISTFKDEEEKKNFSNYYFELSKNILELGLKNDFLIRTEYNTTFMELRHDAYDFGDGWMQSDSTFDSRFVWGEGPSDFTVIEGLEADSAGDGKYSHWEIHKGKDENAEIFIYDTFEEMRNYIINHKEELFPSRENNGRQTPQ